MKTRRARLLALAAALSLPAATYAAKAQGDAFCSDTVCVQAIKTEGKVTYTLHRPQADIEKQDGFGWIAIGMGSTMAQSPMIIAWPYENTFIISHRLATANVQPRVVDNPSVQATFVGEGSLINGSYSSVAFDVADSAPAGNHSIIWAYGATNPQSFDTAANLLQHKSSGNHVLDLTKQITVSDVITTTVGAYSTSGGAATTAIVRTGKPTATNTRTIATSTVTTTASTNSLSTSDWTPQQRLIVAHGVFGGVGMLVLLPLGVLVGRLARTYLSSWVRVHWILQAGLGGPFVLIALALGVSATEHTTPGKHFFSAHRRLGLAIFILAFLQIILGTVIHVFPGHSSTGHRPIQNYAHAVLGLAILALGYAAVWTGFGEFDTWSGLGQVGRGWKAGWGVFLGIFALAYLLGLLLLRRQQRPSSPSQGSRTSGPPSIHSISAPLPGSGLLRRGSSQPLDEYDRPLTASRTRSTCGGESLAGSAADESWLADGHADGVGGEGLEMRERERWETGRAL